MKKGFFLILLSSSIFAQTIEVEADKIKAEIASLKKIESNLIDTKKVVSKESSLKEEERNLMEAFTVNETKDLSQEDQKIKDDIIKEITMAKIEKDKLDEPELIENVSIASKTEEITTHKTGKEFIDSIKVASKTKEDIIPMVSDKEFMESINLAAIIKNKEEMNIEKEIAKLRKEEAKLNRQVRLIKYSKPKVKYTKRESKNAKRKRYRISTKREYYKGRKVTQNINYKRTKYATKDYYPTYDTSDLSKDFKIQRKRENILKDTL